MRRVVSMRQQGGAHKCEVLVAGVPAGVRAWPARVSLPLADGVALPAAWGVRPVSGEGPLVGVQTRVLTRWPSGAPRWLQADFQAQANGPHELLPLNEPAPPPDQALNWQILPNGAWQVQSGPLAVGLSAGGLHESLHLAGQALNEPGDWGQCGIKVGGAALRFVASGGWEIEASGPWRLQLRRQGWLHLPEGEPLLHLRCRYEWRAGWTGFELSFQYSHQLPQRPFLELPDLALDFRFSGLAGPTARALVRQPSHGLLGTPRVATLTAPLAIRLDQTRGRPYVSDPRLLGDTTDYPYFLAQFANTVDDGCALHGPAGGLLLAMHDLVNLRPKGLLVAPGAWRCELWPAWAGPLVLPQGRALSQRLAFTAMPGTLEGLAQALARPANLLPEPALAWLSPEAQRAAGPTWLGDRLFQGQDPSTGLINSLLHSNTGRLTSVAEYGHYGDSPQVGYMRTYATLGRTPDGGPARPHHFTSHAVQVHTTLEAVSDLEPVWTNNEYDPLWCLMLEALRTRQGGVLAKARATARHQIEVDFVHYSDHWQQHRGTPCHTFNHVVSSTAYPSHQWTQGLYYYYCVTGDDDVPEVIRAIGDFNASYFERPEVAHFGAFNREAGWGIIALVFAYELSGEAVYRQAAERVLRRSAACFPEWASRLALPPAERRLDYQHLVGAEFTANTLPMAAMYLHQATGEPWVRDYFLDLVRRGLPSYQQRATGPKIHDLFSESLPYAWELTGDRSLLRETLWHLRLFLRGWQSVGWVPPGDGPLDGKQYARVYRGLVPYLSACERAGLLAHFAEA